jgi:hypothetical protein
VAGRHPGRLQGCVRAFRLKVKASPAARPSSRQGSVAVPGSCGAFVETRASNVSALQHQQQHAITRTSISAKHLGACTVYASCSPTHNSCPWNEDVLTSLSMYVGDAVLAFQTRHCRQLQAGRHLEMYLSIRMRRRKGGRWVLLSNFRDCCWYSRLHRVGS